MEEAVKRLQNVPGLVICTVLAEMDRESWSNWDLQKQRKYVDYLLEKFPC